MNDLEKSILQGLKELKRYIVDGDETAATEYKPEDLVLNKIMHEED